MSRIRTTRPGCQVDNNKKAVCSALKSRNLQILPRVKHPTKDSSKSSNRTSAMDPKARQNRLTSRDPDQYLSGHPSHQPPVAPRPSEGEGPVGGGIVADGQRKVTHGPSFSVFHPNEQKRNKILMQAQKEEIEYDQHKQASKLGRIMEPPRRLGDGSEPSTTGLPEARLRQQKVHQFAPKIAAEKSRALKEADKQKEEEALRKKKDDARRQAERNEEKERNREKVDLEDVRAKRLQHLGM